MAEEDIISDVSYPYEPERPKFNIGYDSAKEVLRLIIQLNLSRQDVNYDIRSLFTIDSTLQSIYRTLMGAFEMSPERINLHEEMRNQLAFLSIKFNEELKIKENSYYSTKYNYYPLYKKLSEDWEIELRIDARPLLFPIEKDEFEEWVRANQPRKKERNKNAH